MLWTRIYLERFDRTHGWPAALRAAAILKRTLASPPPTVAVLARLVGCSRSSLIRDFHDQFGTTVGAFTRQLRIQEAMRLLHETTWSIEAIAETVGFKSTKNLYAAIRHLTGLTPAGVRRHRGRLAGDVGTQHPPPALPVTEPACR